MSVHFDPHAKPSTPRDAASVVLLREGADGIELFFVKRNSSLAFMGGVFLFPGGKLDEGDCDPAVPASHDGDACASRLGETPATRARGLFVAAARECLEEAGVLFTAGAQKLTHDELAALRHRVDVEHEPFGVALASLGLALDLGALVPFARWITPPEETRRFDARFFMARVPADAAASHDTRETVASEWLAPRAALERFARREIVLAPPTYRTVQHFAALPSAHDALAHAPATVPTYAPRALVDPANPAGFLVVLPGDPLHAEADPLAGTALSNLAVGASTRFAYHEGVWRPGPSAR